MINKQLIKDRFRKSLETYEANSDIQTQMADKLIEMISPVKEFNSILELGCGSGVLTKKIVSGFKFNEYDAIDIVEECSEYINKISPKINFINSDIEEFIPTPDRKYNLIISNATLQWVEKLPEFLEKIYSCLEQNGMLVFTTFGTENFKEIKQITGTGLKYYSLDELKTILQDYIPFSLKDEILQKEFDTPKDVLHHLKLTGVNSIEPTRWTKSDISNFEEKYQEISPKLLLTYNPIYVAIVKI